MIRSSSRARTTERGFVLVAAIVLAVLYFGLMELVLIDASRELNEAQRFRSRTLATTVAENAAELSALAIATTLRRPVDEADAQGEMKATMERTTLDPTQIATFRIEASGQTKGVMPTRSRVVVQGTILGGEIRIAFTQHSQ